MIFGFPRRAVAPGAVFTPASLTGLLHWYQPEQTTLTLGAVDTAIDQASGAINLVNATAGARPTITTASANWNNKDVINCNGTQFLYGSDLSAANWKFISDGTGATIISAFRRTTTNGNRSVYSTGTVDTTSGVDHWITDEQLVIDMLRGVGGTKTFGFNGGSSTLPANTKYYSILRIKSGHSPEYDIRVNGVQKASGSFLNAASSSNPNNVLCWGVSSNGSNFFIGELGELIVCNAYITDTEAINVEAYLTTKYG